MHFNSKLSLLDKLQPIIHNNAYSREQVILSESGETSAQTEHRLRVKTALNKHVVDFDVRDIRRWTFYPLEEALLWTMDLYFGHKRQFEVKTYNDVDLFPIQTSIFWIYIALINGLECCLLINRLDYCDVFISCLDSHSDGTHSLQSIHWWGSGGTLHFSKSDEETNSSTSWMAWDYAPLQLNFIFGWTIPPKLLIFF